MMRRRKVDVRVEVSESDGHVTCAYLCLPGSRCQPSLTLGFTPSHHTIFAPPAIFPSVAFLVCVSLPFLTLVFIPSQSNHFHSSRYLSCCCLPGLRLLSLLTLVFTPSQSNHHRSSRHLPDCCSLGFRFLPLLSLTIVASPAVFPAVAYLVCVFYLFSPWSLPLPSTTIFVPLAIIRLFFFTWFAFSTFSHLGLYSFPA